MSRSACFAFAFAVAVLAAPAVFAHTQSTTVVVSRASFATEAGTADVYKRLAAASRKVCRLPGERGLQGFADRRVCERDALEGVVLDLGVSSLASLHEKKTGRTLEIILAQRAKQGRVALLADGFAGYRDGEGRRILFALAD
jgi:UrcA family protein